MTNEEAIISFKSSNEQAKLRLEVEKMRMDIGEINELEFYIERNERAIKALEQEPKTVNEKILDMLEEFDLELSEYEDADLIRVEYIRQDIQEKIDSLKEKQNEDIHHRS